jgi:hypothetical protein
LSQVGLDAGAAYAVGCDRANSSEPEEIWPRVHEFRDSFLSYQLNAGVRCITGHIHFSRSAFDRFSNRYCFVTALRDPVSRFLSDYFKALDAPEHSATDLPLERYLDSYAGRQRGCTYTEYFSGLPMSSDFRCPDTVILAKENLERLHLVGFTDDMVKFSRDLSAILGVRLWFGHENRSSRRAMSRRKEIDKHTLQRVERCCAADIEVYEYARRTFAKAKAESISERTT